MHLHRPRSLNLVAASGRLWQSQPKRNRKKSIPAQATMQILSWRTNNRILHLFFGTPAVHCATSQKPKTPRLKSLPKGSISEASSHLTITMSAFLSIAPIPHSTSLTRQRIIIDIFLFQPRFGFINTLHSGTIVTNGTGVDVVIQCRYLAYARTHRKI